MKTLARSALLLFAASCGSSSSGGGTVPADLRDVERAGEGLVTTTFGEAPARMPSWTRAATVLSILQQTWSRAKSGTPGLPTVQVKMVDDAIAQLATAIPAMDQKAAVIAANKVGLACPELFDFFHPDAPLQIVRMDAVFRQVGIDAHFGDFNGAAADLASLKTDWANAKAAVSMRAPMCHRVGGTATVNTDIETSFANLTTSIPASNVAGTEMESDNGALEIDTLELLFDCPPDNAAPTHGLGAKCTGQSQCDAGQVCDTANAGGKCAPAPTNKIGTPCMSTVDCGTDSRAACNTQAGDNYPGGYCFMEPCDDIQVCPPGATCVAIGGELPGCFKGCTTDADCRASEGYVCQLFVTTPPKGFGPTDHACAFACKRDNDCQLPLKCTVATGKCTP